MTQNLRSTIDHRGSFYINGEKKEFNPAAKKHAIIMLEFYEALSESNKSINDFLNENNESNNSDHICISTKVLASKMHAFVKSLTVNSQEITEAIVSQFVPTNGLVIASKIEQYYKVKREVYVVL
jgi:hypothetical protein